MGSLSASSPITRPASHQRPRLVPESPSAETADPGSFLAPPLPALVSRHLSAVGAFSRLPLGSQGHLFLQPHSAAPTAPSKPWRSGRSLTHSLRTSKKGSLDFPSCSLLPIKKRDWSDFTFCWQVPGPNCHCSPLASSSSSPGINIAFPGACHAPLLPSRPSWHGGCGS